MNFLNIFESRVSSIFGASSAPFSFKKLAKQAAREMEDQTLVISGVNTAPALYTVLIANEDDPLLAPFYTQLTAEVSELVKAEAEKKRYTFVGEPLVRFMIDPSLKSGKFSVFAENVDAPTLGRLYEEERAYQQSLAGGVGAAPTPAPAPAPRPATPAQQRAAAPMSNLASAVPAANPAPQAAGFDPFSPADLNAPIPVPQTVSREQMAAMSGAAAGTAVAGAGVAAGIAGNMASARTPQQAAVPALPTAQLVDVVTGESHAITRDRAIIGRERATADIALSDPNVSRRHAELIYAASGWSIEDLNSTNGTMVNNRRVTRCPLRDGDLLTFGLSTFEFRD